MKADPRQAAQDDRRLERRPSWWRRLLAWIGRGTAAGESARPQCPT